MEPTDLQWRKSSRSSNAGASNCVEVATADGVWYVRDSKNPDGGILTVHGGQWRAFMGVVKQHND